MSYHKYTYYQVLGIQPAVSSLEIKQAYRQLVISLHPDLKHSKLSAADKVKANQRMAKLNEAYETLKDKSTREIYDSLIGVNGAGSFKVIKLPVENTEQLRVQYLNKILRPAQQNINRILRQYKNQLAILSQDIYDQNLVDDFEQYVNEIESILRQTSQAMTKQPAPSSLLVAELMVRRAIAQAVDGLEELRMFCGNYDYNHLSMAGNLFAEATNLCSESSRLTKP